MRVPLEVLLRGLVLQVQALSELQQCHTCSIKESALLWHVLPVHGVTGKSAPHVKLLAEVRPPGSHVDVRGTPDLANHCFAG